MPTLKRFAVGLLFFEVLTGTARADSLSGFFELNYNRLKQQFEDATGQRTDTEGNSFRQRYNLAFDKGFFPHLTLSASGLVERTATQLQTDGTESDSTITKLRPYASLRLRTPLYLAETAYSRNEEKTDISGGFDRTTVLETYSTTLQWRPDRFPDLRFQYIRTNNYDKDRLFRDTTNDRFQFVAAYKPVNPLILRYEGTLMETDNRLDNFQIREVFHNGKISYADSWWRGRVNVYSEYDVSRRETEVTSGGGGEISLSVPALEGLSAIDDTPAEGALGPNLSLIDGNLAGGSGINLGMPPPGGDARPRNVGLRFAVDTEVNTLIVWIDREIPVDVASSFFWRVYSSADNRNWTLRSTVSPAIFDTLFNRFEVRFPAVTERYVKVVVDPLSSAVPGAIGLPPIQVTELQASNRRPAAELVGKQTQTSHRYNQGVQVRILKVPSLVYQFSYSLTKREPSPTIWFLSNGLLASHRFTRVLTGAAMVAREDGKEPDGNRVAYVYTASLAATPLETLQQTWVFSGKHDTFKGTSSDDYSLFLQNIAQLYQGVDLTLGGGLSSTASTTGRKSDTAQLNGEMTLAPNQKVTVNLSYTGSKTHRSGGELAEEDTDYTRTGRVSLSLRPFQTIYLYGAWTFEETSDINYRSTQEYTFSFSPFPGGMVHLNVYYNERFRSEDNTRVRTVTPNLRWNIRRGASLDLAYSDILTDSDSFRSRVKSANGTLRVAF